MLEFDDAWSRRLEAVYLSADVVRQRRAVVEALGLRPGERVLDIGCGPGLLACEMAGAVAPSGSVHGVDISPSMVEIARRRPPPAGAAPPQYTEADALAVPFADATFDAAVSTQVYEYVDDMPAALAEVRRVLRPGGRLLVLDTDWDSIVWHSRDPQRMRRVLAAWDAHLVHPDLPRKLTGLLEDAGFVVEDRSVLTVLNAGYDTEMFSAGTIGLVGTYVAEHGIAREEVDAWARDLTTLGRDYFFSLCRYLFLATAAPRGRA
jgi:SAM-dependent methyltransferase